VKLQVPLAPSVSESVPEMEYVPAASLPLVVTTPADETRRLAVDTGLKVTPLASVASWSVNAADFVVAVPMIIPDQSAP